MGGAAVVGASRCREVWCALYKQQVEVEFEVRGLPGFRHPCAVTSCTAFDPPTAVACRRRCLGVELQTAVGAGAAGRLSLIVSDSP